jgi:hypothetical protein
LTVGAFVAVASETPTVASEPKANPVLVAWVVGVAPALTVTSWPAVRLPVA